METHISWNPSLELGCSDAVRVDAIETVITPRASEIGDFEVRRALPPPKRQTAGPFIFFDQAGPAEFVAGEGVGVRPNPNIGLATVTYLYRGEFRRRDSLGSNQIIRPGALNWMVAASDGTSSPRAASGSTEPKSHGARRIGATAVSTRRPAIATNSPPAP